MNLQIISPESVLYDGAATSIVVPSVLGEFEVLENHAPVVSILNKGKVKLKGVSEVSEYFKASSLGKKSEKHIELSIVSGVIEVDNNKVVLVVEV